MRVLLVEDEAPLARLVERGLRKEGFVVLGFPINVRFHCQSVDGKATGSWCKPHRESLTKALEARDVPGQGMRYEKVEEEPRECTYFIFLHISSC